GSCPGRGRAGRKPRARSGNGSIEWDLDARGRSVRKAWRLAAPGSGMKRAYLDGERRRDVEIRPAGAGAFEVFVDGERVSVGIVPLGEGCYRLESEAGAKVACVTVDGRRRFVTLDGHDYVFEQTTAAARRTHGPDPASGEL